jgi:hypothetical protein
MTLPVPLPRTSSLLNAIKKAIPAIGMALCVQFTAFATGADPSGRHSTFPGSGYDTVHSIQVNKSQSSKKYKIRLYPDARQQVLFFSANGEDGKVYQLFLFDMDGRLVSQTHIRNKETTVLTNISEGNFLFEVFTDDERIENGELTVR